MLFLNSGGGTTITSVRTILYSAWFCPFAQRAWCALNEFGKMDYTLVEALTVDPTTEAYIKDPGLLESNPQGLVPTVVQHIRSDHDGDESRSRTNVVCDSLQILRDLYELQLGSAAVAARLHDEATEWNRRLCSPLYPVLMKQTQSERMQAWENMVEGISAFCKHLEETDDKDAGTSISFYKSSRCASAATGEEPSLVDFCVFPFVHRLYIVEHYKGLTLPDRTAQERQVKHKIELWRKRMEERPSVRPTLASPEDLIPIYRRYADGTAKSKVGDSVRQGKQAHDV